MKKLTTKWVAIHLLALILILFGGYRAFDEICTLEKTIMDRDDRIVLLELENAGLNSALYITKKKLKEYMETGFIKRTNNIMPEPSSYWSKNSSHNPMNVKTPSKGFWEGQISKNPNNGLARFKHPIYSLQAAAKLLIKYQDEYNRDTIYKIIDRYCDAPKQKKLKYAHFVANHIGVKIDQKIDVTDHLPQMLWAMAKFESGVNIPDEILVSFNLYRN